MYSYSQPYLLVQVRVQFPHSIVFMRPIKSLLVLVFARASAFSSPEPFSLGHSLKIRLWFILVPRPTLGRPSQWPWVRLLICLGIPTQRLGRKAYVLLLKNMATAMNATVRGRQKQYILHLQKQIILKLS